MAKSSVIDRIAASMVFLSLAVVVSGTKACQENYDFASQTSITPGAVDTATVTPTGTDTITPVTTGTVTPGTTGTTTPTVASTVTAQATGVADEEAIGDSDIFSELSALSNKTGNGKEAAQTGSQGSDTGSSDNNWLGDSFKKPENADWKDSDGDGFADELEERKGGDMADAAVVPQNIFSTNYASRVAAVDSDQDGMADGREEKFGSNPMNPDTDDDGRPDGIEVLSGGNPTQEGDSYTDSDGDGLSDSYEREHGMNPTAADTDSDGLRDDREIILGANPVRIDSDGDGISDGVEVQYGADPIVQEVPTIR